MEYLKWLESEFDKAKKLFDSEGSNMALSRLMALGEAKAQFMLLDTSF